MKLVGVRFDLYGKTYFFDSNDYVLDKGDFVVVDTEKGLQFGQVFCFVNDCLIDNSIEYKKVIRKASKDDIKMNEKNIKDSKKAINKCNELINSYNLDMRIIDANFTFDREQLIFKFISDDRVDFRQLARDLGSIFKTRIELRQVGIRDKAKEVGGIGPCGRKLCCNSFLKEFDSVSINMAKNQNLSLNPTKINGVCGRLLCCLKYENDTYSELKNGLPDVGKKIKYNDEDGKVLSVDVFNRKYTVLLSSGETVTVDANNDSKE